MPSFARDGLQFNYRLVGDGLPFVFQHGLGGDVEQPFALFAPPPGVRLLSFDCRGHGETRPLGEEDKLTFDAFADDLIALLDHLDIPAAIVGGISMGAGVALNMALRYPDRVRGLVLVRPAWLDGPMPRRTRETFAAIAALIRQHGTGRGRDAFLRSAIYRDAWRESPATVASLLGQFDRPRAEETVAILERLPAAAPLHDLASLASLTLPALALANRQDPVHPIEYGERLAAAIPGARCEEITSKAVSAERHAADVRLCVAGFLSPMTH